MLVDIFLFMVLFYLSIPAVVGYFAKCYGRSFWLWFTISFFLPVIAHVVLYILVTRDTSNNLVLSPKEEAYVLHEIHQALEKSPQKTA